MKHPEAEWMAERVETDAQGKEWFHTRDIVEAKTMENGAVLVHMIDKTTGPFQLTSGTFVNLSLP
jgi:hypothetical protein